MEETAFKETWQELNPRPCVFEKALLTRCADCGCCRRLSIAERETVACTLEPAWTQCGDFLDILHEKAQFALKLSPHQVHLPHAKLLRLQCGGLQGLQTVLAQAATPDLPRPVSPPGDIYTLLNQCRATFGNFEALPYAVIMRFVSHYQVRGRKKK